MRLGKRIAAALLGLVMIAAMSTGAYADVTGTITVDNPINGQTYTAYKIFDAAYDTKEVGGVAVAGDHYSYTIDKDSEWFVAVRDYAAIAANGLTLEEVSEAGTYYAVAADGAFSAPAFARAMKAALEAGTVEDSGVVLRDNGSGEKQATGLSLGYYLVTSNTGALCNLTTTNPAVTIHDKNDVPFEKADDRDNVEIGETVNYTITGKVPDTTGFTEYHYVVTDKMSEGLTLDKDSIAIRISNDGTLDDADGSLDPKYYEKVTENAVSFEDPTVGVDFSVSFKAIDMNADGLVGKYIFITYSATVNEDAVSVISKNTAVLNYSNNPENGNQTAKRTDEETVYSAKIVIDKYEEKPQNANDTTRKLAGAKFVLMNGEKNKYYYYDETANAVSWVELGTGEKLEDVLKAGNRITEVTTADNGAAEFVGLKDGTYYLLETEAPKGYNPLKEPVEVVVDGTAATETNLDPLTYTAEVANSTGTMLPSTGGIGTTVFYAAGSVLLVGAAVLLIVKRRRDRE